MKKVFAVASVLVSLTSPALAGKAIEGDEAKKMYDAKGASTKVLAQKDKTFILRDGGKESPNPEELHVKAGEIFFLTNEEEKFVHNVYDTSDKSWVLQKQEPAGVAAVSFDEPGTHELRCAIHPKMKIKVVAE